MNDENTATMAIIHGSSDSERRLPDKLPGEVKSLDDMAQARSDLKRKHRNASGPFGWFRRWQYGRQIDKIGRGMKDPLRSGARGEMYAIRLLSALDDSHHIFCDLRIALPNWVTYRGRKNLKSAQMDMVVASPKGVFMIEVKNWSDRYASHPEWSPHEQTERAGQVLWTSLQDAVEGVRVTPVLLSIRGNIPKDPKYDTVLVSDPSRIVDMLSGQRDVLAPADLDRILERLGRA